MTNTKNIIHKINLTKVDEKKFASRYVGCLVLTQDNKILLQQRGQDWNRFPGYLSEFGGRIELDESPVQALIRELQEELGAQVNPEDIISLGTITEEMTNHEELLFVYFWHDKQGTITGCYEGEAKHFNKVEDILHHSKIMDSVVWLLQECKKRRILI